jgi:hypothetical protein
MPDSQQRPPSGEVRNVYFILDHHNNPQPVDATRYAEWFTRSLPRRNVAFDQFVNDENVHEEISVSTVFLGINHNWGDGPPILYETMVFGGGLAGEGIRCSTRKEAKAQHAQMCTRVAATLGQAWTPQKPKPKSELKPFPRTPPRRWRDRNSYHNGTLYTRDAPDE